LHTGTLLKCDIGGTFTYSADLPSFQLKTSFIHDIPFQIRNKVQNGQVF